MQSFIHASHLFYSFGVKVCDGNFLFLIPESFDASGKLRLVADLDACGLWAGNAEQVVIIPACDLYRQIVIFILSVIDVRDFSDQCKSCVSCVCVSHG